ncbi:MAG: phenylalanine--tRNA ligase subunit beta, partial [Gammaproteobacteria bacterium]
FDLSKLKGAIVVRHARAGERLTTLDGAEHELLEQTLLIADDNGPLAMAGIMGGAASAVVAGQSRDIFLESAYFNPLAIAGKARAYGLHTDSSHRFERGVSPDLQVRALERATALLLDIVGGEPGPITLECHNEALPVRTPVTLRQQRIARVLGMDIPAAEIVVILEHLGMQVSTAGQDWQVTPPPFRFDIEIEEDLIEEVARIYGYNNLPDSRPHGAMAIQPQTETQVSLQHLRQTLVDLGYQEAITYSFVDPALQTVLAPAAAGLALANPISADLAVMRTSLWPGLVGALRYNLNRQQDRICLFECGLNFIMQDAEIKQVRYIGGALSGRRLPLQWSASAEAVDFFDAKAHVEAILRLSGDLAGFRFVSDTHDTLHPGQTAAIYRGEQRLGWVGMLHPARQMALGLSQAVYLFELELTPILQRNVVKFVPMSKFPAIMRDLAIVVDESISAETVMHCMRKAAGTQLRELELFDVYMGKGIDSGRKSLAFGLTLQDLSRTLTDEDVEQTMKNVLSALQQELKATLRE